MDMRYKSLPFLEVKASDDGGTFEGYCAVFNNLDSYGDLILPGAFARTLADFLSDGQVCFNHGEVIGKPLDAREDAKGLFVKGRISDTARGRDCKTLLKDGVMRKMSIGYRTVQRKAMTPDDVTAYWKSIGYQATAEDVANMAENARYGQLSALAEVKLYEASPVGFPANTQADITGVKNLHRLSDVKALLAEAKAKGGKCLSKATHAYLKSVHDSMAPAMADLKALLDAHAPDDGGDTDDDDDEAKSRTAALAKARAELALIHANPTFARTR